MEDKLAADYVFSVKTRNFSKEECDKLLHDLAAEICDVYYQEDETPKGYLTTQLSEVSLGTFESRSLVILGEEMHFCCYFSREQRLALVGFYICEMRPADQVLVQLLVEKYLSDNWQSSSSRYPIFKCLSAILPETEDIYRRTQYEQLAETLGYTPVKLYHLERSDENTQVTSDYILFTNSGFLVRHVTYGEVRLSMFTWNAVHPEVFHKNFPESAWSCLVAP